MENKLMSVSELLKKAYEMTKANAKTWYSIAGVMYAAYLVLVLLGFGGLFGVGSMNPSSQAFSFIAMAIVFTVAFIAASIWVQAALYQSIATNTDFKQSFIQTKSKLWKYFLTSLLSGLIVMVGFILLIVPGIIFTVWYLFGPLIVITEGLTGMAALRQSKSYVKGRLGAVLGKLLAVFFIFFLVQIFINALFDKNVEGLISAIFSFLIVPFASAYMYLIYQNLKQTMPSSTPSVTPVNEQPVQSV